MPQPPPAPPAQPRTRSVLASAGPSAACRGLARLIDMIMQVCVGALLGRLFNGRYPAAITAVAAVLPTLQSFYIWDGQSFGKRYMDVKVVRQDGGLLSLSCTCQRELTTILTNLPCFANCIAALWGGRTLADRIQGTRCTRSGRPEGLRMLLPDW